MNFSKILFITAFATLIGCTETITQASKSRILLMGDSLFATNTLAGRSVAQVVEGELGEEVIDRSVRGSRFLYRLPISGSLGFNVSKQFQHGPWDWVILNGGGNDLWLGCGCNECEVTMSQLISHDAVHGEIPRLVNRLRRAGTRVIYVGYLRTPGVSSLIDHCRDEGEELERRVRNMSASDSGFHFLSMAEIVPPGDRSFHKADRIHPSIKASIAIGRRISSLIQREGG